MKKGREISITAMALLTEKMKTDDVYKTQKWFHDNKNDFEKEELIAIIDELLHGIYVYGIIQLLEDVGYELDREYDDLYQNCEVDKNHI